MRGIEWAERWARRAEREEHKIQAELDAEAERAIARLHAHLTLLAVAFIVWGTGFVMGMGEQVLTFLNLGIIGCQEWTDYSRGL